MINDLVHYEAITILDLHASDEIVSSDIYLFFFVKLYRIIRIT